MSHELTQCASAIDWKSQRDAVAAAEMFTLTVKVNYVKSQIATSRWYAPFSVSSMGGTHCAIIPLCSNVSPISHVHIYCTYDGNPMHLYHQDSTLDPNRMKSCILSRDVNKTITCNACINLVTVVFKLGYPFHTHTHTKILGSPCTTMHVKCVWFGSESVIAGTFRRHRQIIKMHLK